MHSCLADTKYTTKLESDEDYEGEEDAQEKMTTVFPSNTTDHHQNCTFNGTVYFDDECSEWMRNFYIILSLSIVGMIGFMLTVFYCRKLFCVDTSRDFERLVESRD
jgi:hypothetical protein